MTELRNAIIAILVQYFGEDISASKIGVFTDIALSEYEEYRNYPDTWDDDDILSDMTKHKSCIVDLALYDAVQEGAEFQSMHIESGLYRMWTSKGNVFTSHRVVPFVAL